jgi:hypothetical protein
MVTVSSAVPARKNMDVECLRCGVFNLAENVICGRCGASLPLVYDSEGGVFGWGEGVSPSGRPLIDFSVSKKITPEKVRWYLRAAILFFALGLAFLILRFNR